MREVFMAVLILTACGGGTAEGGEVTSGGMTTSEAGGTTSAGTSGGAGTTTSGTPTEPTTTAAAETTSEGESSGEETGGTTGSGLDCAGFSAGPWEPALWLSGFDGSEDLAFDGMGGLALKRGDEVVVVSADKNETVLATDVPTAYGTRFLADGRLLVALPQAGEVIAIDGGGTISDFLNGVQGPNGIFPDGAGDVWISEFGGSRVIRVAPDLTQTTIVMGPDAGAANGVVYDPGRGLLFYTKYQAGEVRRVAIDEQGAAGPSELVVALPGTAPDGLVMDACGYLYVVDQGGGELYRVALDEAGVASGAEPLAQFPSNVANAQFGAGPGFDAYTLYVAGNPGDVYTLAVEFPGAPTAVTP